MVISTLRSQPSLGDGNVDYATFSCAALLDARGNIQRERYPQNYENLQAEIATRPQLVAHQATASQPSTETVSDAAIGMAIVDVVLSVVNALP